MKNTCRLYCLLLVCLICQAEIYGQIEHPLVVDSLNPKLPVGDWVFIPQYTLEGNAKNYPGPKTDAPQSPFVKVSTLSYPLIFHGEEPTQRIVDFLEAEKLPQQAFSVELWLLDHVNQPVGALVTEKGRNANEEPAWLLGYYENDVIFTLVTEDAPTGTILNAKASKPWKRYRFGGPMVPCGRGVRWQFHAIVPEWRKGQYYSRTIQKR